MIDMKKITCFFKAEQEAALAFKLSSGRMKSMMKGWDQPKKKEKSKKSGAKEGGADEASTVSATAAAASAAATAVTLVLCRVF